MAEAAPNVRTVGVRELRANLSALLREAQAGRSIRIVSRGEVLAQIGPPAAAERRPRELGRLRGRIWVAPDFDEWPEDILESFERPL